MSEKIHLEVVTPDRKVLVADADRVEVPGIDGELGILPGHTDLVTQLKPADYLTYHSCEKSIRLIICGGFAEVGPNLITVLADNASLAEDIDLSSAIETRNQTERALSIATSNPDVDFPTLLIMLERSKLEIDLVQSRQI